MNNILVMLLAFLIFAGIVLLYTSILQVNMGEGAALSASSIMLCLAASGIFAGTFRYGMCGIYALALIGVMICHLHCEKTVVANSRKWMVGHVDVVRGVFFLPVFVL